ncbi:MAG: DUF1566 domain-containing protein, partial [Deltaproteobacteria bacterium]|nr:DUF1566 domain-containing protein [Deltaproteobacteria bacterium]
TDNLTGLIWLKNPNCFEAKFWSDALAAANRLASGSCGLSDGSHAGDWRLPNITELFSLTGNQYSPALPAGHPFTGVQSSSYWSSTTYAGYTDHAWVVDMLFGDLGNVNKADYVLNLPVYAYIWPVRGGQ